MRRTLMVVAAAAALAMTACDSSTTPHAPESTTSPTMTPTAVAGDPTGEQACSDLLDPDDRLLTAIESGMSEEEIATWGGEIYYIATDAAESSTPFVSTAGQDILDSMPDKTFQVRELLDLAYGLADACLGAGLVSGQEFYDGIVAPSDEAEPDDGQ